jgi:hypothetical protein
MSIAAAVSPLQQLSGLRSGFLIRRVRLVDADSTFSSATLPPGCSPRLQRHKASTRTTTPDQEAQAVPGLLTLALPVIFSAPARLGTTHDQPARSTTRLSRASNQPMARDLTSVSALTLPM